MDATMYHTKLRKAVRDRVVIFIDAANLERSVKDMWVNPKDIPDELRKYMADQLCWRVDYQRLKAFFQSVSTLQEIRFYSARFNSEPHDKFLSFLRTALHFKLETKALKEYKDHTEDHPHRKANFDVEITVDATYTLTHYDTFILFSGDCDFAYLLKFLRGQNKITIVFSRAGHVAKELPPASNYYFDIADFRFDMLRIALKHAKNPAL